jgi:hypothetical protein
MATIKELYWKKRATYFERESSVMKEQLSQIKKFSVSCPRKYTKDALKHINRMATIESIYI